MATSLSQQLQQLKVPGQPSSRQVDLKKRPSLLFSAEEAAELDIERVFDIGRNGLEELVKLDNRFAKYEESLFSEGCMSYERSVQTTDHLLALDRTISDFLRLLSPYVMLQAASKCLEWLIRVFRINSYNIDALMECMLPYHDTVLFARILQLLPLKDKTSLWHWLRPSQKADSPMAKSTLIQHCISVPAFLSFVCDMVSHSDHKIIVTFYCSTMIGVIDSAGVGEGLIVMVMPHLTSGLKSSHDHIKAATYIILSHLITNTSLSDKLTNSLLGLVAKHLSASLIASGVMMMCHFCATQQTESLPNRAVKYLAKCSQLVPTLADLSGSHDVSVFANMLLCGVVRSHCDVMINSHGDPMPSPDVIVGVVKNVLMSEALVVQFTRLLLDHYIKYCDVIGQAGDGEIPSALHQYYTPVIRAVDNRYPNVVDTVVGDHLMSCDANHRKWSHDFVNMSLPGVEHHVVMDTSLVAAVGVHHGNANIRRSTLLSLFENMTSTNTLQDKEFVSSAVLSHLHDDDHLVVENVVKCCLEQVAVVTECVPVENLIDALLSVLGRVTRSHDPLVISEQCLTSVMSLLDHVVPSADHVILDKMLICLLPHLLYCRHGGVNVTQSLAFSLATSSLAQSHPLLIRCDEILSSHEYKIPLKCHRDVMTMANCALIGWFASKLATMETTHLTNMVVLFLDMCCHDDQGLMSPKSLFSIAMVTSLLSHPLPIPLHIKLAGSLTCMVSSLQHCNTTDDVISLDHVISSLVRKKGSPWQQTRYQSNLLLWVTSMVTKHLRIPEDTTASLWLKLSSPDPQQLQQYYLVLLILYHLLVRLLGNNNKTPRLIMKALFDVHFQGRGTLLRFLALIWCGTPDMESVLSSCVQSFIPIPQLPFFSPHSQLSSLQFARTFLQAMGPDGILAIGGMSHCPMVPALLVALLKPDKSLRVAALNCLQLIHTSIDVNCADVMNMDTPLLYLCDSLLHHQVELVADHTGVVVVMAKIMNNVTMETDGIITAVMEALMYHVISHDTPQHVQCDLLRVIGDVYHKVKFTGIVEMLRDTPPEGGDEVTSLLLRCYCVGNTSHMDHMSCEVLLKSLKINNDVIQHVVLEQLTPQFYTSLTQTHQHTTLSTLLDCCLDDTTTPPTATDIVNTINKLPLNIQCVLQELDQGFVKMASKSPAPRKAKRRKLDTSKDDEEISLDKSWQRVGIILDAVIGSVSPQDSYKLVPSLFGLLESCQDTSDHQLHHIQQQLLTVLCWVVTMTTAQGEPEKAKELLPETQFNIDLIVQTIRSSCSTPQTQQQAMMLLSVAASIYPVRILHNIMSIFTFMGTYLSRHDDQYSFEVILKAMDNLLPVLVKSGADMMVSAGRTPKKSTNQNATVEIIRVFCDAIGHIPNHRQLIVFHRLVDILGSCDHLHVTIMMLLGKLVERDDSNDDGGDHQQKKLIVELCKELNAKFPMTTQVSSLHKLVEQVSHLPDTRPTRSGGSSSRKVAMTTGGPIFNTHTHTTKQIQQFKLINLSMSSRILTSDHFINQVTDDLPPEQEGLFLRLLQSVISYIITIYANETSGKYWDHVIKKCYSLVDNVTHLLPIKSYTQVMSQLITDGRDDIQKSSIDIIQHHFTSSRRYFATDKVTHTVTLLPLLDTLIQRKATPSSNKVSAILLISVIVHSIGTGYHDSIIKVVPHLLKLIKSRSSSSQVVECSVRCVGEVVRNLGGHFIPFLPDTIPLLLNIVVCNEHSVVMAMVSVLSVIIEALPKFLSPYVSDIITKVCCHVVTADDHTSQYIVEELRTQLATLVPCRIMVSSLIHGYHDIISSGEESIMAFLHILHVCIVNMSVADVGYHSNELTDLFIKLFHYRSDQNVSPSLKYHWNKLSKDEECICDRICKNPINNERNSQPKFQL
ncbi:HEAT repeat-containing protein 1-like isoform X3 [Dysidea avara]|uniref:HEAT repeat-containing protein 1-like isoform X3 n=1 Tax=Dysidea avara TaxID=196820 RepID=UPI0033168AD2